MTARSPGPLRQFFDGVRALFPRTPAQFAAAFLTQVLLQVSNKGPAFHSLMTRLSSQEVLP